MLYNYFITALRNILYNPLSSVINLVGLAIGFACFILITLYINYETSFDTQFSKAQSLYRLDYIKDNDVMAASPYILAETIGENYSQIEDYARIVRVRDTVERNNIKFNELVYFADKSFFSMFDFPFAAGDRQSSLNEPTSIVLSAAKALKFFGKIDVLGEVIRVKDKDFKVTGIIASDIGPTTVPLDIIMPMEMMPVVRPDMAIFMTTWIGASVRTYFQLKADTDIDSFNQQISEYANKRGQAIAPQRQFGAFVVPLLDVHLHSTSRSGFIPNGSIAVVYSFTAIALLILFLACINFMNLSTARATQRAKEVGVRKSLGAYNGQLITQFIGESVFFSMISFVLSLALVTYSLPFFSDLLGIELGFSFSDVSLLVGLTVLAVSVGVVAGSYPAFYLSAFNPALVLKGNVSRGSSGILLRKGLIILQFAIAAVLIVATGVVYQQMQYAKSISLGYERNNLIVVNKVEGDFDAFSSQLLSSPTIESVVQSHVVPTETPRSRTSARLPQSESGVNIDNNHVSYDFFKTFGIKLLAGRVFDRNFGQDLYVENDEQPLLATGNLVINLEMAKRLGKTPEALVGQMLVLGSGNDVEKLMVIGVVDSSYYSSIRSPLKSMAYYLNPNPIGWVLPKTTIRIKEGSMLNALSTIDKAWKQLRPGEPINRTFLDDDYNALYQAEQKQATMLNVFAALAIIITCLGLFGLASFTTQRRVKEIGIRKVLGAGSLQISWLITKEFTYLVMLSNVLAWPIAYFVMRDWLNTFANRIELGPMMFLASAVLTVLVSWLTVGGLAYKAASSKPINALRCE